MNAARPPRVTKTAVTRLLKDVDATQVAEITNHGPGEVIVALTWTEPDSPLANAIRDAATANGWAVTDRKPNRIIAEHRIVITHPSQV